jgi:hypothetical protein
MLYKDGYWQGFDLRTVATVALFFCTMLYKDGYLLLKGVLSNQASSQKRVYVVSSTWHPWQCEVARPLFAAKPKNGSKGFDLRTVATVALFFRTMLYKDGYWQGFDLRTVATVALFFCTMLYKDGYWLLKGVLSNQASSQKRVCDPSPTVNLPILNRSFFIFIRPYQKWESLGMYCVMVLCLKHLLLKESLPNVILINEFKHPFTQKSSILQI